MHCSEVDETATGSANFWSEALSAQEAAPVRAASACLRS
jgi:hypothetical protein